MSQSQEGVVLLTGNQELKQPNQKGQTPCLIFILKDAIFLLLFLILLHLVQVPEGNNGDNNQPACTVSYLAPFLPVLIAFSQEAPEVGIAVITILQMGTQNQTGKIVASFPQLVSTKPGLSPEAPLQSQ